MKPNHYLREERERHGWSQARLAEMLGTEAVTVGRWERGISFPYPYFREKLCQLFGKSLQELGLLTDGSDASPDTSTGIAASPLSYVYDPATPLPLRQPLIGRDKLLHTLKQQLFQKNILALNGLPGVGKTTLATQLAHDKQVLAHFPDGVLWAGLGPQPNVAAHFSHWGKLLGVTSEEMMPSHEYSVWARTLRAAIGQRRFLFVIDDAWQSEIALAFKVGGPQCAYLLTTRFPQLALLFAHENVTRVPELTTSDGITLLTHYAPEMNEIEPETTQLVQAVGGLPLALALMGKYLHMQGYEGQTRRRRAAITRLRNVETRLRLAVPQAPLEQSSSLPVETPLSLQSLITVSVQLLPENVQRAFFAFSVFPAKPNSFSEEAALAICEEASEALDLLSDTGLLENNGAGRYTFHQTILDYARTSLRENISETRMVAYYVEYIGQHGQDDEALERENENILTALEIAQRQGMQNELVQGVLAFIPSLQRRGLYALAYMYLQYAYETAREQNNLLALTSVLLQQGEVAVWQGEHIQAGDYLHEALALARQLANTERISAVLSALGFVTMQRGDEAQAEIYLQESLALARQLKHRELCSEILRRLGILYLQQANASRAQVLLTEGLALARDIQHTERIISLLINLCMTAKMQNDVLQAEMYITEALAIAQQNELPQWIGFLYIHRGEIAEQKADFAQAEQIFREGLELARQFGHGQQICRFLLNLTNVLSTQKQYEQAIDTCQEGLALAHQLELRQDSCLLLIRLGKIYSEQGNYVQAEQQLQDASSLAQDLDTSWLVDTILYEKGELYLRKKHFDEAIAIFTQLQTTSAKNNVAMQAWIQYKLACIAADTGDFEQAQKLGLESLSMLGDMQPTTTAEITEWLNHLQMQAQKAKTA